MFNGSFKIFEMRNNCTNFYLINPILFIISFFYIFPNYSTYIVLWIWKDQNIRACCLGASRNISFVTWLTLWDCWLFFIRS